MAFSDRQWGRLLTEIEDRRVVPVIGPEMLVLNLENETTTLARYVARELVRRLEIDEAALTGDYGLSEAVSQYLRQPGADPDEAYFAMGQIMKRSWPTPEPLKKLAAITHFDVYFSVTFDLLLEQALNEVRFHGESWTRSYSYSRTSEPADLPGHYKPAYERGEPAPAEPAVYHLFGKLNALNDYALREEDVLQFSYRLQSSDRQPRNLFDVFRVRNLLVLGCSFPGWLTRFFLAATKGERLFTEGARDVIADGTSPKDQSLVLFLERRKASVYEQGDAVAFVEELHQRWSSRYAGSAPTGEFDAPLPAFKPESIFISYANEDLAAAQAIHDALETAGLDVWFDKRRLEPGDDFRDKILQNIERSSFFVPVISRNTATQQKRFFRLEWNKALEEAPAYGYQFIVPVIVDDTGELPDSFKKLHWQRLEGGRLPDSFVRTMVERIRELRRAARSV